MRELTKSRDKKILGVAGGLAEYFEIDKSLMRAIWAFAAVFMPPMILAYIILGIVLPTAPAPAFAGPTFTAEPQPEAEPEQQAETQAPPRRNYRRMTKSEDKWIAGVCGGIAEYFDIDPVLVRALFLIGLFMGAGLLAYIILAIIMPRPVYQFR